MSKEEVNKEEISNEDIDSVEKELETQSAIQDEKVTEHMQQMGYLWDKVHSKLYEDNVCFHSKKPLVKEGEDPKNVKIHVVEASQVEPGIVAFVSLSDEAYKEITAKQMEEQQKKDNSEEKKE